jgi:nucleoid-associated protein YgaU
MAAARVVTGAAHVPKATLAAQKDAKAARAAAQAECSRLAAAKNFGRHVIQRRNFLRECMIERGFNRS